MTRRYAPIVFCYITIVAVATTATASSSAASKLRGVERQEVVSRTTCVNPVRINFETGGLGGKLYNGEYITDQWLSTYGLVISGSGNGPQILNTSNPGPNKYLGSPNMKCSKPGPGLGSAGAPGKPGQNCVPLGNVLYVAGKYYVTRLIHFQFNEPRYVQTIGVLDIKSGENVAVHVQTPSGEVSAITAAGLGDNAVQDVSIYKSGISAVSVRMSTGAITHIDFCKSITVSTPVSSPHASPVSVQNICQNRAYITFSTAANGTALSGGQYVMNEWIQHGVSILAYAIQNGFTPSSRSRLFDTLEPGTVTALGSPNRYCTPGGKGDGIYGEPGQLGQNCIALGKVLIVQHSDVSSPDSSTGGAVFTFRFTDVKTVYSFGMFNVPLKDTAVVTLTLTSGAKKLYYVAGMGRNGYQTVNLGVSGATKLTVYFPSTGAITHLDVCGSGQAVPTAPVQKPVASPVKKPVSAPVKKPSAPVQSRVDNPSPLSIPIGTPAPSPYATVNDNGMFPPVSTGSSNSVSTSNRIDNSGTPAPSPYATVNDNGMFPPV